MSGFLNTLREEFVSPEFRHGYVDENARRGLAYQITALREAKGWSKAEFARQANKPDSNIHRWEDPTYGKFSLTTLIEIASIFDVALSVRFVSFGDLLGTVSNLRPEKLAVPNYEQEVAEAGGNQHIGASALDAFYKPPEQRIDSELAALAKGKPSGILQSAPNGSEKITAGVPAP